MDKYLKALKIYFKLKQKYDSKLQQLKEKIIKEDISWKEKREKFERRKKCIKCQQIGGSKFSYNDGIYTAICGSNSPCELKY